MVSSSNYFSEQERENNSIMYGVFVWCTRALLEYFVQSIRMTVIAVWWTQSNPMGVWMRVSCYDILKHTFFSYFNSARPLRMVYTLKPIPLRKVKLSELRNWSTFCQHVSLVSCSKSWGTLKDWTEDIYCISIWFNILQKFAVCLCISVKVVMEADALLKIIIITYLIYVYISINIMTYRETCRNNRIYKY